MGCDTKGFVITKEKSPFKVWSSIRASITKEAQKETGKEDYTCFREGGFSHPNCEIADFAEMMTIFFKFKGEERQMSVHLDCASDYDDVKKGKKIIVSLGAWGESVRLIEAVLRGFEGAAFITENDCEYRWRKIKAK
jgi:hypothetical protein